jgi:uncharacterized protein (DUF1778 family)
MPPALSADDRRTSIVYLRVTSREKKLLQRAAAAKGTALAPWLSEEAVKLAYEYLGNKSTRPSKKELANG